jgi:thiamine kinase-like enzyme
MATSLVREGMTWLEREVEISKFLHTRGGAVTVPSRHLPCGPFERAGLVISFWEREEVLEEPADPELAGKELCKLHALLRHFPIHTHEPWGAFREARVVFERAQQSPLLEATARNRIVKAWQRAERIVETSLQRTQSLQIVHGDAHLRNVMATRRGVLWTDWEDAFVGPVEWDVACVRSRLELFGEERDAILRLCAAYGSHLDEDLIQDLGFVRNLQVILWLNVFAERDSSLIARMHARLAHLPPA